MLLCFSRDEFKRSTLFFASGSVRDTFDFKEMERVEILWKTREQKYKDPSQNIYILNDFLDAIVEVEQADITL